MINYNEILDGEAWELFARDFLETYGFFIQSQPSRGADGGKDFLVTESIKGRIGKYQFQWLVSCKHYAVSKKSVSESDEPNILERLKSFNADGFIGFYSTISSSGFGNRLDALRNNKDIKDYKIFDGKYIVNHLITGAYSHLLMSYLPISYSKIKPIHLVMDEYQPLYCKLCGKDLLIELFKEGCGGNIVYAHNTNKHKIESVYCVCSKDCDKTYERDLYLSKGYITKWHSLKDLLIPVEFLRYIITSMNRIRDGLDTYTEEAYVQKKEILIKLSQRILRYTTSSEMERVKTLMSIPPYL